MVSTRGIAAPAVTVPVASLPAAAPAGVAPPLSLTGHLEVGAPARQAYTVRPVIVGVEPAASPHFGDLFTPR